MKLVIDGLRSSILAFMFKLLYDIHTYETWICGLLMCQISHGSLTTTDEPS